MSERNGEHGFTAIEVMVGMIIAVAILGAMALAFARNSDSALAGQRQAGLAGVLSRQIEYVRQLVTQNYTSVGFAGLALNANPATPTDATLPTTPQDPNDFITPYVSNFVTATSQTAENLLIEKNFSHTSSGTIDGGSTYSEELQVDPTNGKVSPVTYYDLSNGSTYSTASSVPAGDDYATVYTYVTLTSVGSQAASCPTSAGTGSTTADARRVVVAAVLHQPAARTNIGPLAPQYSTTIVTNPIPSNQCQGAAGLRVGLNLL